MTQKNKTLLLPTSILVGALLRNVLQPITFIAPYLIFLMLFITYCKITLTDIKITKLHFLFLGIQILGGIALYCVIAPFNEIVAQGAMICVFIPTATAAGVISGMLGGNIAFIAIYTLISSLSVAIIAPIFFSFIMQGTTSISFWIMLLHICEKVIPLLVMPFIIACSLFKFAPTLYYKIREKQYLSFYLWLLTLMIVTSSTFHFMMTQDKINYNTEILLVVIALVICIIQYKVGQFIGKHYGYKVSGALALGHKNTILGIWMAQTCLYPLASIAPASYVLWQNFMNSYKLWKYNRKKV